MALPSSEVRKSVIAQPEISSFFFFFILIPAAD